ncbi:MAG: PEGA domain-containing protein [Alphaproteobacteria bacterium]|nr:MAG: hypothetical protein B6I23_02500 [Rickettsiaceae bacterium 4572_127]
MKKILILGLIVLGGCASIIDGEMQQVSINSNVKGASILVNGMQVGKTPFVGQIKRQKNVILILKKRGYPDKQFPLQTSINPTFFGNIISGGTTGGLIDYSSGSWVEYSPNMIYVTMEK